METLKRDWKKELTLRDVLVTICCLLIQPNPDSALNAEAGKLLQDGDWGVFERRAKLMTGVHASVPESWVDKVEEARRRGEEDSGTKSTATAQSEKSKGKSRATTRSRKQNEIFLEEESENPPARLAKTAAKGPVMTPVHEESDPDSSWIPRPPPKRMRTLNLASDNIFGIRSDAPKQTPGAELDLSIDDAPPFDDTQLDTSETSFWDFAAPSQSSFLATTKGPDAASRSKKASYAVPPPQPQQHQQPTTPVKSLQPPSLFTPNSALPRTPTNAANAAITSTPSSAFSAATIEDDPFAFALCWLAYQKPPVTPSARGGIGKDKGKGKAKVIHVRSPSSAQREQHEWRRLKAVGFCVKKYNRGEGGPRTGLRRL